MLTQFLVVVLWVCFMTLRNRKKSQEVMPREYRIAWLRHHNGVVFPLCAARLSRCKIQTFRLQNSGSFLPNVARLLDGTVC